MKKGIHGVSRYLFLLLCGLVVATQAGAGQIVYSGWNGEGVSNNPPLATVFTLTEPTNIASIYNYHWNDGAGQDASLVAGTIGIDQIVSETETVVIGRWPATSWSTNPGVVANTNWVAYPNILLGPGTYKIVDSDPATWSYSSPGTGFSHIEAGPDVTATVPVNTALNVPLTQPLTVTFNDMRVPGASLNQVEVSFLKNGATRTIVATTKSVDGNTLTITPVVPWRADTVFTVTLPVGCALDGGYFPSAPYQFTFKTALQ